MTFFNLPKSAELKDEIIKKMARIREFVPETKNRIVLHLQMLLNESDAQNDHEVFIIQHLLTAADRLIRNLELAKKAVLYAQDKMQETNPESLSPRAVDMTLKDELKDLRNQINIVNLTKTFKSFLETRNKLAERTGHNEDAKFEQEAYQKGKGINIAMWYRHQLYKEKKKRKKLGNCTEQANVAFVYLYTLVYENAIEDKKSLLDNLERIDVENDRGGHTFLLIDKKKIEKYKPQKLYSMEEFLNNLDLMGDTCVAIDPWNKKQPFYPVSDAATKLPECGRTGAFNIEFGLCFNLDETIDPKSALRR